MKHARSAPHHLVTACVAIGLAALALAATLHMRRASFFLDDYLIDSIVRSVDGPLWFFTHRHFFAEHLHRPMAFVSWWLLERLAPGPSIQLTANALLLATSGALLTTLLVRWRVPTFLAALVAAVWISHPGSVVFASWAANRFELLASTFSLACMHAWSSFLLEGRRRAALWAVAFAGGALLSKESAVLLAPVVLVMTAATDRSTKQVWRHRLLWTVLAVAGCLLAFAAYRLALNVRLPREILDANERLAWIKGIAKWWRYLPAYLAAGGRVPLWAGTVTLVLLPVLVVAAMWRAALRTRVSGSDTASNWPVLVGGICLLAMPVIQVGHLTLANMVFLDPAGRMTGLFVERFYFQGLMGLLMVLAGLLSGAESRRIKTLLHRKSGLQMALGSCLLGLVIAQVLVSRQATRAWPQVTADILHVARAAAAALHESDAGRNPSCRARFSGATGPVFSALAEAMVKASDDHLHGIARCIIEADGEPMISLTHVDRIGDYPLKVGVDQLPRVGSWVFLRSTLAGPPVSPVTHAWRFNAEAGRFEPVAP